jgi:hypothetical protein
MAHRVLDERSGFWVLQKFGSLRRCHRHLLRFRPGPQAQPPTRAHQVQAMIFPSGPHIEADRGCARIDRSHLRDRGRFVGKRVVKALSHRGQREDGHLGSGREERCGLRGVAKMAGDKSPFPTTHMINMRHRLSFAGGRRMEGREARSGDECDTCCSYQPGLRSRAPPRRDLTDS